LIREFGKTMQDSAFATDEILDQTGDDYELMLTKGDAGFELPEDQGDDVDALDNMVEPPLERQFESKQVRYESECAEVQSGCRTPGASSRSAKATAAALVD